MYSKFCVQLSPGVLYNATETHPDGVAALSVEDSGPGGVDEVAPAVVARYWQFLRSRAEATELRAEGAVTTWLF